MRAAPLLVLLLLAACSGDAGNSPPPTRESYVGVSYCVPETRVAHWRAMRTLIALSLLVPALALADGEGEWTSLKRGAPIGKSPVLDLAKILAAPEAHQGMTFVTEGEIQKACSRKGCWMELAAGDKHCRVTFKDYGFFVPKDAMGARARVEGVLEVTKVARGMVEHLSEEGAKFQKAADGSAMEIRLVASGVELTRPAAPAKAAK